MPDVNKDSTEGGSVQRALHAEASSASLPVLSLQMVF
jgi:hypothetical protein